MVVLVVMVVPVVLVTVMMTQHKRSYNPLCAT